MDRPRIHRCSKLGSKVRSRCSHIILLKSITRLYIYIYVIHICYRCPHTDLLMIYCRLPQLPPSGNLTSAIENCHRNSDFSQSIVVCMLLSQISESRPSNSQTEPPQVAHRFWCQRANRKRRPRKSDTGLLSVI